MNLVRGLHDLSLAILVGSITGVAFAVVTLFDRAPSREFAGHVGNAVFEILGLLVLVLSLVVLAAQVVMSRRRSRSGTGTASLILAVLMVFVAAIITLWLTPAMNFIWANATHAADGSGLMGEDRARFTWLHVLSNILYMGVFAMGASVVFLRGATGPDR